MKPDPVAPKAAPQPPPPTPPNWLRQARWNPYVVGAGLGLLSWAAFVVAGKPLGISTAVSELAGAALCPVMGVEAVKANAYWAKFPPALNYGVLFLVGTFLGALASALAGRTFHWATVPPIWAARFGPRPGRRLLASFLGGALLLYGARMAGGCTSGHGISGTLQLAVSSWLFFGVLFAAGLLTAVLLFRRTPTADQPHPPTREAA